MEKGGSVQKVGNGALLATTWATGRSCGTIAFHMCSRGIAGAGSSGKLRNLCRPMCFRPRRCAKTPLKSAPA